jgi:hypothetical protein
MPADSRPLAFELRLSLFHVRPEVWRLIRVPRDIRMDRLDRVIQAAFGWTNSHMHQFHLIDAKGSTKGYVGRPDPDPDAASGLFGRRPPTQDETKRILKNFLAKPGDRIGYEYDFGDGWLHSIELIAVHPQATRMTAAICLDGARACPPEDCGGPPGYEQLLETVANPKAPDHAEMKDWLGEFDAAAFELAATNRALARIKL